MANSDDEKVIKFCIYCPNSKLEESKKNKFCMKCKKDKKKRFNIPKETTAEDLEKTYKNEMIHCYICGEELTRVHGHIMCIDGCEVLDIEEDGSSKPDEDTKTDKQVNEKPVSDPKLEKSEDKQQKELKGNEKQLQAEQDQSRTENETSNTEIVGGEEEKQKLLNEKQNLNVMTEPVPSSVTTEPNNEGIESKDTKELKAEVKKGEEQKLGKERHEEPKKENDDKVEAQSDTSSKEAAAVTTVDSSKKFEENAAENQSHKTKAEKQELGTEEEKLEQKDKKSSGEKSKEVTPSRKSLFSDPPDIDELKKHKKLQQEKTCKKLGEKLEIKFSRSKISLEELMKTWQEERKEFYTWDTLLSALNDIGENKIADNIKDNLIESMVEYPDEETHDPLISASRMNEQQEEINLFAVLDLSVWKFEKDDLFTLSFISKEISDGKTFSCPFKCIFQSESRRLYSCQIYVPHACMWNGEMLRYKYVIICKSGETRPEGIDYQWRIFKKGKHTQYDVEIKPTHHFMVKWLLDKLTPSAAASNAMSIYIDWAIEKGWISVGSDAVESDINESTRQLSRIIVSLANPVCFNKGKVEKSEDHSVTECVIKMLLAKLSLYLSELKTNLKKFLSGLIVTDLLFCLRNNPKEILTIDEDFNRKLAESLYIPLCDITKCTSILSKLSYEFKTKSILPVVLNLCNSIITKSHHYWIGVLPLIHTIKLPEFSFGQPYRLSSAADRIPSQQNIGVNLFCGLQVEKLHITDPEFAFKVISLIQPYFKHDWLIPRAFVYLCPYKDMFLHIRNCPDMVPLICWKVGYICLPEIALNRKDETEELTRGLQCLITPLRNLKCSKEEKDLCFKGANKIVRSLVSRKITESLLFKASVQLFLTVLDMYQQSESIEAELSAQIFEWMALAHGSDLLTTEIMNELYDWSDIFSFSKEHLFSSYIPKLSQRLNKINAQTKTEILSSTTNLKLHPEVMSGILNSVMQSAKDIKDKEPSVLLASLRGGSPRDISQIMGAILSSMYPSVMVPFSSLFTTSWAIIMELYVTILDSSRPTTMIQEEKIGRSICEKAYELLHNFFNDLETRKILPSQLEDVLNAGELPKTLQMVEDFLSLKIFSKHKVTIEELKKELKTYQSFTERNKKLQHFAHTFTEFSEEEAAAIKHELKRDYTKTSIDLLWQYEGEEVMYKFCSTDIPYNIIEEVFCLTNHEGISSKVFNKSFRKWKNEYLSKHKGSASNFKVVIEEMWKPMFQEYKNDLHKLHDGLQMPLKKVKYIFSDISDKVTLNQELEKWCNAVNEPDKGWIREAAQKILDYQELCRYAYSAQTLMQLKKTLALTGDFSAIEALLPKEDGDSDVTLATVESTAAETASILKDIADVPHRRACLETFCSCMSLVEWVRSVALNLGQLQNVVQVANQTMDGDLVKQLLQDLLKFGSAFAPLIYEVDPKESCEALINRCKAMWPLIDERQNLMKITTSCNARLGELKRVQESLSDFQKSNVEQMDSINTRGIYYIEAIPGRIIHSPDDAVCLRMRLGRDQTEQQKIFRLDDLRDLQSKLVLVAAENADKVNKFIETLSKIEGIAGLLINLQEAGLMDYTHFHLVCGCSEYKKAEFDSTIASMEKDLAEWQKNVEKYRKQYPHLNYYTSQQLLDLRKELGKLKKNPESPTSHALKQLLLSVTPNPSQPKIAFALSNAVKTMSKNTSSLGMQVEQKNNFGAKSAVPAFDLTSLNEERKEILKALRDDYDFKVSVILAAYSELEEDADEDDVREWCMEHEHEFKDDDDVDLSAAMSAESNEDEDPIAADNPLVLELLEEEYSQEIAFEAVQKAKQDPQLAREIASDLNVGRYTDTSASVEEHEWSATKYSQVPLTVKMEVKSGEYLDFVELGEVLDELAYKEATFDFGKRNVPSRLVEEGKINLLATDTASTWKALLFLYMADPKKPLPTHEEVLICTKDTTVEEVTLLWHRAVNDEGKKRLFCLVNADQLPFSVSEKVLDNLEVIIQGSKDFRIAVLISAKDQARNHLASRLSLYLRKFPRLPLDDSIAEYVSSHIGQFFDIKASSDQERQIEVSLKKRVNVVLSKSTGMGKTLRVRRMAKMIQKVNQTGKSSYINIPIHGPEVSVRHILELMEECRQDPTDSHPQLIHFNVAQNIIEQVDWLLFKILVLGGLDDEYGNIWRRVKDQVCVVECTLTKLSLETSDGAQQEEVLPSVYALLSYFPQTICDSPNQVQSYYQSPKQGVDFVAMDEQVFREESVQRVYQYLRRMKAKQDLDGFKLQLSERPEGKENECLDCLLEYVSNESFEPSWSDVRSFIQFLNANLYDCEKSPYCHDEEFAGFKQFVVKFSILMAKEFTEPSMNDSLSSKNESDNIAKKWDTCSHPYLFFNQDGYTMTFLGLWVDEVGNLLDYNKKQVIKHNFMDKGLRTVLNENKVCFQEDYESWDKEDMILKLIRVLGISEIRKEKKLDLEKIDSDRTYVLTVDNLMKMLAIHMKFRCGIPVIMIGETGCGKTRLLRYLCEMQDKAFGVKTLICLKVHGGINADRVYSEVEAAAKQAIENKGKCNYTVLFFDEVNTTEALGLIKEVICDRTLNGKSIIPDELKFAAACNPYRIHDDETIKSLQKAGLGFYLKDGEKTPKLGHFPLRKLVYRVLPLPQSMYRYVYDFGTVSGKTENDYIKKIVKNQLSGCKYISTYEQDAVQTFVGHVLCDCQAFMREQKNECKYVSLRDVVRAMILFKWFLDKLCSIDIIKKKLEEEIVKKETVKHNIDTVEIDEEMTDEEVADEEVTDETVDQNSYQDISDITRALLYSVSVCYYARLTDREPFVQRIVKCFTDEYNIPGESVHDKVSFFVDEVNRIQNVFLNTMTIPSNIAHNAALRENIFMMVVCIENRLPLFIVGKPGSSKSLSKSIVSNSMQGRYSTNELLQHLKQVQLFPYQCNQFSTTKSLIDVFEEAMNFQKSQDVSKFASVVVLEEIGLAEDAPGLPLKVLHPYLEDGTSGADPYEMDIKPEERVAFIGISNWALDPAKMNRGIMVTRCPPEPKELIKSAFGIANMVKDDNLKNQLTQSFDALAEMYQNICSKQEEGENTEMDEAREFFGLRDFYTLIKMICWKCIDSGAPPSPEDYRRIILRNFSGHSRINPLKELPNPDLLIAMKGAESEALEIVKESVQPLKIQAGEDLPKQENRYLLFITENQSALQILQNKLLTKDEKLFVFYGSSFPKDTEYTQVCVNINKIKVCMEKGIPVVLLNYEQIYESLYDVLNQCYTELPTGRYVDLGLRSYRIKCRVDPNFRLIIIAERDRVFKQFPAALINRLEKHFVVSNTILTSQQKSIANELRTWVDDFAHVEYNEKRFSASDSFVGYQEDTPSSVILHVSNITENEEHDEKQILDDSIALLLQTASIDAVTRLKSSSAKCDVNTIDWAFKVYFEEQQHFSMIEFLSNTIKEHEANAAMIQITTFGPLLTQNYIATLSNALSINKESIKIFQLSDFHTEMDFTNEVKEVYASEYEEKKLLIVQCEFGERKTDLIACARHRLIDEGQRMTISGITHVVFIIQLPRVAGGTSFASFQGGSWISTHIDELTCHSGVKQVLQCAISQPLHKFFHMLIEKNDEVPDEFKVSERLKDNVQVSVSMIISAGTYYQQMESVIDTLLQLITSNFDTEASKNFTGCLLLRIEDLLQQRDHALLNPDNWAIDAAMDRSKLQASFTLINSIRKAVDTQLQRILAYIISCSNKNNNLNLLIKSDDECLIKLWLSLFSDLSFLPFDYDTIATTAIPAIDIKGKSYSCKFPFSWEVIDQVNAAFSTIIHKVGINEGDKKKAFGDLVNASNTRAFVKHIERLPLEQTFTFYDHYLHDFVRSLVLPFNEEAIDSVYEILLNVMRQIVNIFEPAVATGEPFPLINAITAVHLAYNLIEQEIFWLAELSEGLPELPNILKDKELLSSGKIVFHFKAVECVIDHILPQKADWKDDEAVNYFILNFHSSKSAIETILYLNGHDDISNELLVDLRSKWQTVMSIVLFAEHVIAPFSPSISMTTSKYTFLKRYSNVVRKIDYSEPKILTQNIRQIQAILKALQIQEQANCQLCKTSLKITDIVYIPCEKSHMFCEKCFNDSVEKRGPRCPACDTPIPRKRAKDFCIPEKKRKEYEQLKQVQQYCLDFFMEFVSQCCFSPIAPKKPSDEFYKALLEVVTDTEHEDYKNLFPYEEEYTHGCPIARSVLLQLLLEHNPTEVQKKLQEYQNYIKRSFGAEYMSDDQELTLLSIKSLEDGLHKKRAMKESLDDELEFGTQCLNDALIILTDGDRFKEYQDNLSVEFMQCIANVRFGICFAVDMFYQYYCFGSDRRDSLPRVTKEKLEVLQKSIQDIIGKGVLKEPHQFLVKQFVRQFGFPYLGELGKLTQFKWLNLPKSESFDGFIVSGKEYTTLRAKYIYSETTLTDNDLIEELKKDDSESIVIPTLVFYQHIKSKSSKTEEPGQKDLFFMHQKSQGLLSHVFTNGHSVTGINFNPNEPETAGNIAAVVIHWVTVLEALIDNMLFTPFRDILAVQTDIIKEMYWPTMDDNILDVVVDARFRDNTNDTWWKCPKGHDYFVQDCGNQIVGDQKCFCGAEIGGKSYAVPKEGNKEIDVDTTVLTRKGHMLGDPKLRSTDPSPQRDLSPLSNCIIRFFVNATCVWIASSNNKAACQKLIDATITEKPIEIHQLLNYFWHHLEIDIQTLCRATQHSFDDCILLLHTLIHNALVAQYETTIEFDVKLKSRNDRQCWETKFDEVIIKPKIFLQTEEGKVDVIEQHIERGRQLIIEDSNLDHRALLQMVYETVPITSNSIMPHLWIYRPLITIDHVSLSLEKDTESADLSVLREFLRQIKLLEALACLPDVIHLQQFLYEMCHLRIDENEAEQSLEEFIRKGILRAHKQQKLLKQADNFCAAWNIVRKELPSLMSVTVPDSCISMEMSPKQPLEFFVPMRQGKGLCSLALASYLAKLQNEFIDFSWEKLKAKAIRGKRHIPSHKIQDCHMISFKDQLSHVIFSHCKYSLKSGHGADIKYDFPALEKHILDRFVRGRPLITCDILLVSYRSEVLDALIFRQIRRNIPQENLLQKEKEIILNNLQKSQRVQQCIDTVNVALGFLQHQRSNPRSLMKRFMSSLKMEGKLPKIVEDRCELSHAISLWRLVNVEQAKQITNGKEDPFPGINQVFKELMDEKQKEVLQTALNIYDMDQFLEVLYEFIVTQVKSRKEYEADDELIEAYVDVCDYFDLERIPSFAEKFPKEFSLKHVTEIWKYAVRYQQEQITKQQ